MPEKQMHVAKEFQIEKIIFGLDAEGKTITDNDIVKILTHPYTGRRGVRVGSNEYGKCIVDL